MAGMVFRTPTEGIEGFQKAVDLMQLIQEIVQNPDVTKTIASITKELDASQTMSEAHKKEFLDAQEIIAQSHDFLEEFEQEKTAHSEQVLKDNTDISTARQKLASDIQAFMTEKSNLQKSMDKNTADATEKLLAAQKLSDEATTKYNETKVLSDGIAKDKETLDELAQELEAAKLKFSTDMNNLRAQYEADVAQLVDDRVAFEARKKRFDDALRE